MKQVEVKDSPRAGSTVRDYLQSLYQMIGDECTTVVGKFNDVRIIMVREKPPGDGAASLRMAVLIEELQAKVEELS